MAYRVISVEAVPRDQEIPVADTGEEERAKEIRPITVQSTAQTYNAGTASSLATPIGTPLRLGGGTAQHSNTPAPQTVTTSAPTSNITDRRPATNIGQRVPQNLMANLNGSPAAVNLIISSRVRDL